MQNTSEIKQRVFLAAANTGEYDCEASLEELAELAETAGAEVAGQIVQNLEKPVNATYLGAGKLKEIKGFIELNNIDLVIFDDELSGMQIRNIEDILDTTVIDRTMLILDIFAGRAQSSEGKLQVELAQQKYLLPRLVGVGKSLSKQQGGIGSRGAGESKLEYDRRHIRRRITALEQDLEKLAKRREMMRTRRKKDDIPTIAIVGYTNVGKSTLLNRLTDAGVLAQDMLFATLDPTARALTLPDGQTAMLVDTVGLIRRLPHQLVQAFHSTLEEASNSDLILLLCDISNPDVMVQSEVTMDLLDELSCGDIPKLVVYNKSDKLCNTDFIDKDNLIISAATGEGIDKMLTEISKRLSENMVKMDLLIPFSQGRLLETIRKNGKIFSEEYLENGTKITANVDRKLVHSVKEYIL